MLKRFPDYGEWLMGRVLDRDRTESWLAAVFPLNHDTGFAGGVFVQMRPRDFDIRPSQLGNLLRDQS